MIRTILPGFKRHRLRGYDAVQLATALVATETMQPQSVPLLYSLLPIAVF